MKKNWFVSIALGLVAAVVYVATAADRSLPTLIAPLCGAVSVVTLYHLVRLFVVSSTAPAGESRPQAGDAPAVLAGLVASAVFLLTPAVRAAATRFDLRLFAFTWALLVVALVLPFLRARPSGGRAGIVGAYAYPVLAGVAWAFGVVHSALFLALLPLLLILVARVCRRGGVLVALLAFAVTVALWFFRLDPTLFLRRTLVEFASYYRVPGWFFVFAFTTLPFLTVLFSEDGALRERPGVVQLLFHGALSFVTVLAVLPPLSPSALMAPYGRLPVATSAFAAAVAGYLVAYWWVNRRLKTARVLGTVLALALAGASVWNTVSFDGRVGLARRVVIRMDEQRAREALKKDPRSPLANYVMGSLALKAGRDAEAESYLRAAVTAPQPLPFALNDFAEVLRRGRNYAEAERYARKCVACAPHMYVGWETLGSVLMDAGKDLAEAESAIRRACELSKGRNGKPADVRMLVSLVRVQLKRGNAAEAQSTIREIRSRAGELSAAERTDFEKLTLR